MSKEEYSRFCERFVARMAADYDDIEKNAKPQGLLLLAITFTTDDNITSMGVGRHGAFDKKLVLAAFAKAADEAIEDF